MGVFIENSTLPLILLAFMFALLSIQGAQQIEMASGTDTFVSRNSQLYQDYDHLYLRIFSKQSIAILIEGEDVKNIPLLHAIDNLEQQAASIRGVVGTSSIASAIKNVNFQMNGKYEIPENEQEIESITAISKNEIGILMPDQRHALVLIEMAGDSSSEELKEIMEQVRMSADLSDFPPGYAVTVTGDPAFMIAMEREMNSSMAPLLLISALLMIVVLYLVFGHVRWKLLPLPIVLLGIIFTFGLMGYLKIPLSMVSMSAFPILIGLGIDYAIQLHNRIEEELGRAETAAEAVIETVKHTGPAVFIALIITALGFVSLFTSSVPMVRDFGKLLLAGIIMCFISSIFVGVTVIYSLDTFMKKNNHKTEKSIKRKRKVPVTISSSKIELFLEKTSAFAIKHPLSVIGIAGLLCISGFYVDSFVPIQTDVKTFVPQDMPELVELKHLGTILGGGDALSLIIKVDDSANPDVLRWMDEFGQHEVNQRSRIYGSSSIIPVIKSMNGGSIPASSNEIEEIYGQIPQTQKDRFIHGNNMLLLNLEIGNAVNDIGIEGIKELVDIVRADLAWMPPPPGTYVTVTGGSVVFTTVISALTTGRAAMTLLGLVMVFIGLLVIYRDWIKAFTPVITMLIVIGWSGGIMYFLGLEYTPMTATLGALILGVGSEYAVLMMERYYEEKDKGAKPIEAMHAASNKIGKAIIASGLTTVFGFSALLASPFSMNRNFGLVTVLDVALALVATFIVFPAVMVLLDQRRDNRAVHLAANRNKHIVNSEGAV